VLATGNPEPRVPDPLLRWRDDPRVVCALLTSDWSHRVARRERLVLLGTGLTALDVLQRLSQNRVEVPITCVSRSGTWPLPHSRADAGAVDPRWVVPPNDATIDALAEWMESVLRTARAEGIPWQSVVDEVREHVPTLWRRLGPSERQRFLVRWRRAWDALRHRAPAEVIDELRRSHDSGRVRTVSGVLTDVAEGDGRLRLGFARGAERVEIDADRLVLCTGPEEDVVRIRDPLLESLLRRGVATSERAGVGLDLDEQHRTRAATAGTVGPWVVGHLARGRAWEATSVPDLREQVADVCLELLRHAVSPRQSVGPR
jgi:uncharacterized NAD(P)/FAD-binding protein YdhS